MMLSMENFPQTENTVSQNIRTLFIVVMWSILMRILYFFTIGSQGFGLVNAYSHTNFLQYLENFALWSTNMSQVGSHLAWLARAWVLGQFLAYLEIFSEGRMELLRLQSDRHNDLASLQNECIILGFRIEGPSPLEILNASPSKAGAQALGPGQGAHPGSWARHRDGVLLPWGWNSWVQGLIQEALFWSRGIEGTCLGS